MLKFEIIIVNDGSKDSTTDYLGWLLDQGHKNIKVIHTHGLGRSAARNLGNKEAQGKYILVLDADDIAYPKRVWLSYDKLDKGAQFVYGTMEYMDVLGKKLGTEQAQPFDKAKALDSLYTRIVHSSVAYTKEFAERFPYREGRISELGIDDWAQQIEAAIENVPFDYISAPIGAYRFLKTAISSNRDAKEVEAEKRKFLSTLMVAA